MDNRRTQSNQCPAPKEQNPRREKRDASAERSLIEVREAHWKALAMAVTFEEEIEWLSHPLTRSQLEAQAHSWSRNHHRCKSRGWKRRCCQVQLEDCHAPYFEKHPSLRVSEPEKDEEAPEEFNLEDLPELRPEVNCFLWGPVESSEEENTKMPSPKPLIEELEKWVTWRAQTYEIPGWWQELFMVPGVDDHEKLAHEVWASFWFLHRVSEWCQVENDHQAPLALLCLCQRNFLLLPNSNFTCQDIQELQQEKTVAYTQALYSWEEKADLPTGGKPCLLVGSVVEPWEEMKCYISFSDEDVFNGMALPEEPPIIPPKGATPEGVQPTLADPLWRKPLWM